MHRSSLIRQEKICTNSHFSLCLKVSISSLRLLWRQLLIVSNWQPPRSTKPYQVLMAVYQCIGQTGPSMVRIRVSQTEALQNQNQHVWHDICGKYRFETLGLWNIGTHQYMY